MAGWFRLVKTVVRRQRRRQENIQKPQVWDLVAGWFRLVKPLKAQRHSSKNHTAGALGQSCEIAKSGRTILKIVACRVHYGKTHTSTYGQDICPSARHGQPQDLPLARHLELGPSVIQGLIRAPTPNPLSCSSSPAVAFRTSKLSPHHGSNNLKAALCSNARLEKDFKSLATLCSPGSWPEKR